MKKIFKNKIFTILVFISLISFIMGLLFISVISKSNKNLVVDSVTNFFKFTNVSLFNVFIKNISFITIIFILGISLLTPITLLILCFNGFTFGFSISSIIYSFGLKGMLKLVIYSIPLVINYFTLFIISYYSFSFSTFLFKYLFFNKNFNKKIIIKRYFIIYGICLLVGIVSTLIEVYLIPKLI